MSEVNPEMRSERRREGRPAKPLAVLWRIIGSLLCLSVAGCGLYEDMRDRAVITVGERRITPQELARDIKRISLELGITDEEMTRLRDPLVDRLLDHYLVLEYGRVQEIDIPPQELTSAVEEIRKDYPDESFQQVLLEGYVDYEEWKEKLREQLLVKKITKEVAEKAPPVTSEEIKGYFDSHQEEFRRPETVQVRQVVTRTREEAEQVLAALKGGKDLEGLARRYSVAPEGPEGGVVGWISRGELPEAMEEKIFSLAVGGISPVVETDYGVHVFEVLAKRPEGPRSLPEVMSEIESRLLRLKKEAFYRGWLQDLRVQFAVKIDKAFLESMEIG